jgi:Flp pilus assembly protein TadG
MSAASKVRTRATVGWRGRIRARYSDGQSESGAVLVEAAFVFPVFLLLLFGMIEFGFIFRTSLTLSSMAQVGARTGAVVGNQATPSADYSILSTMGAGASDLGAQVTSIIIFNADTGAPGQVKSLPSVPQACLDVAAGIVGQGSLTPQGVAGVCNVYDEAQWAAVQAGLTSSELAIDFSGASGGWDGFWSPAGPPGRDVDESGNGGSGPDFLGVYMSARHQTLTGFFPSVTLHETDIIRLEPQSFG